MAPLTTLHYVTVDLHGNVTGTGKDEFDPTTQTSAVMWKPTARHPQASLVLKIATGAIGFGSTPQNALLNARTVLRGERPFEGAREEA